MSLEVKACAALTEPERAEILALQNEVYSGENLKNKLPESCLKISADTSDIHIRIQFFKL